MTTAEYNANLNKFISDLNQNNRPLKRAATSSVQQIGNRIFDEGKKSDGSDIGQYDTTTPLYVNPNTSKNAGRLRPTKGKHGEHLFKSGKEHKTTYVPSYKELKNLQGQPSDKVHLRDKYVLESDFRKGNTPTKINSNLYTIQLDRKENFGKIEGINEKYGMVTDPTVQEIEKFEKNVELELLNDMQKAGLI